MYPQRFISFNSVFLVNFFSKNDYFFTATRWFAKPKKSLVKTTTAGDVVAVQKFGSYFVNKLKEIDYFVSTSEQQSKEISSLLGNIVLNVIPNGVDTKKFSPITNKSSIREKLKLPNKKIFLFSGRLVKRKGVLFLLNQWKTIVQKNEYYCLHQTSSRYN